LREELRLRLHLASKEASKQWDRVEASLQELEQQLGDAGGAARSAATNVGLAVARVFNDFMLRHLPQAGPGASPVHEAMRVRIHTCTPEHTLAQAAQLMWEKDVGCLPVVDEDRRPFSMITDRDICMATFIEWAHLADLRVASAMSKSVSTCSPDDTLAQAAEQMRIQQVRRLPVVDRERVLVGLVTLGDIARYVRLHTSRDTSTLTDTQIASTFAGICEPRVRSIPPPPPPDHPMSR
jgi:CBS domain-containing protein